jgi:hypothetical protein
VAPACLPPWTNNLRWNRPGAFVLLSDDTVIEGPALAAGREFRFQESMATLDDRSGRRSLERLARRMRVRRQAPVYTIPVSLHGVRDGRPSGSSRILKPSQTALLQRC